MWQSLRRFLFGPDCIDVVITDEGLGPLERERTSTPGSRDRPPVGHVRHSDEW